MADINELNTTLKEILAAIKQGAGGGSVSSTGGGKGFGPQSLKDYLINKAVGGRGFGPQSLKGYFAEGMAKGQRGGLGIQQALGSVAGKLGQSSGIGSSAAGALGKIGGPLVLIGKELVTLPWKIKDFAEGLHDANRQFAQYSGPMSAVMAQSDMADMIRKMNQGDVLASSAGGLADARGRLLDELAPIETQGQRFQNNLGQAVTNGMANFVEKSGWGKQLEEIMTQGNDFLEDIGKDIGLLSDKAKEDDWATNLDNIVKDAEKQITERVKPVRPPQRAVRDPWEARNRMPDF